MGFENFSVLIDKAKIILTDPVKLQNFIRTNKKELIYWGILLVAILIIYSFFSDGDFSFCLTLSGMIQLFGFFLIAIKVQNSRSVSGLSLNMVICYTVSFFARLCSILKYQGYLPFDSSGDFIYRIGELLAFIISATMIYMIAVTYKESYNWDLDRINCIFLIIPTFIVASLIHPGLNNSYFGDIMWTFSLYLESVAMFPQIFVFSKKGGEVEAFTSHFVASQGLSRIFALVFWLFSYHELNEFPGTIFSLFKGYVGYFILLCQFLQVVLLSDFMYHYVNSSLSKGLPMTINYTV